MVNDGASVIKVTYSTCLVHGIADSRTFIFSNTKAIVHGECVRFDHFSANNFSFTGDSNAITHHYT